MTMPRQKTAEQEAFWTALRTMSQATTTLRDRRKKSRGVHSTEELVAVSPEPVLARSPSKIRIQVPGHDLGKATTIDEFQATLKVVRRLTTLSEETEGQIVCLRKQECPQCAHSCDSLQAIWTRNGKRPPEVVSIDKSLEDVLLDLPVMILLDEDMHEGEVKGYHKVMMGDTSFLLRRNGE